MPAEQDRGRMFDALRDGLINDGHLDLAQRVSRVKEEYLLRKSGVVFPDRQQRLVTNAEKKLTDAVSHYKDAWNNYTDREVAPLLTPELVDRTWEAYWRAQAIKIGLKRELDIPHCDRTEAELLELRKQNRGVVLMPDEMMTKEGLALLLRMIPQATIGRRDPERIVNIYDGGGCFDIEMQSDPPNIGTFANGTYLSKFLQESKIQGQRIQTYIVGSDFHHMITPAKRYFDETGKSSLPGTRIGPSLANAIYDDGIRFDVTHYWSYGFRTERKRA